MRTIGVPDPILAALDAPLRVLVEAGYNRTVSPGLPTTAKLLPATNPVTLSRNFLAAIPTGIDNALQETGRGRPFLTTPAGPYGVGGPPVTVTTSTTPTVQTVATSDADRSGANLKKDQHQSKRTERSTPKRQSSEKPSRATPSTQHRHHRDPGAASSTAGRTGA